MVTLHFRLVVVPAVLATALLMASSASAQLFTSTASTGNWANTTPGGTGGGLRWSTNSAGPFNTVYTNNSNTEFNTAGTYTFAKLVASGSATLGNITTVTDVNIKFTDSSSQAMSFGSAVKTLDFGAGSVVDFGSVSMIGTNGINKTGAGTLMLTGGGYTGGFTLGAGNVIARGVGALGTGNVNIDGGAIGATSNVAFSARSGGAVIKVRSDFQLGIDGTFNGAATGASNISFTAAGTGFNLDGGARTITLGSSGEMRFGQSITNGSLTLNQLAGASAGLFFLQASAGNSMSALTLDSVTVNALTSNAALGAGTVTLQGANATRLNIQGARTITNAFTIADSAGTKTITGNNHSATIQGTITNNDSTGGLVIGSIGVTTFTVGTIGGSTTTGVTFGSSTLLGTVTMNGALDGGSSYGGDTRIDSSTLKMSGAGAVPNGTKLVFQGTGAATFDLNGTTQTVAGLDDSALAGIIRSVTAGGKLIVGDSNNSTFRGTIISTNSLELEKVGTGKLTLTGANTYTGGTTITAGELEVSSQSLKGNVNIGDGFAKLTFNQAFNDGTFAGNITGIGSFTKKGNDALTLDGSNDYSGGTTVSAGDLIGTTDSLQGAIVNNATVTFRQAVDGTYAGEMTGSGALFKEGAGSVTLDGANTYSGGTTISGGALIGSTTSLQGNIVAAAGTTLAFNQGTNGTYSGILSGDGALLKEGAGAVTLSGANTYTGGNSITAGNLIGSTATILGATTVDSGATLTFNDTSAGTFASDIIGQGALVKTGAGNVTLSGANGYTGGTTVSGGGLTGSTTSLQGNIATTAGTTLAFNQVTSGTYSGILSGAGALVKDGVGAVTLSGANTYTGGTTISGGTLALGSADAIGTSGTISFGGGTLQASASNTTDYSARFSNAASQQYKIDTNGQNLTLATALTSSGGSFTKLGSGTLTLTGANTYSGGTTISGGTLTAGHVNAFGTGALTIGADTFLDLANYNIANTLTNNGGTILNAGTISGGDFSGGTTDLSGSNSTVAAVTGTATVNVSGTDTTITTVSGGTLNVNAAGTTIQSYNGGSVAVDAARTVTIHEGTSSGTISGAGGLAKAGTGTLTLTGTNTYTGATTVTAGLLTVNGNIASSSLTTVGAGATLGGSGTVGTLVVQSRATIAPGNSPGTLTVDGNVTWQAGGNYNWQLVDALGTAGTGWDTLAISGVLDLTALSSVNPFNLNLWSLSSAEATTGDAQNFDSGGNFSWTIATAAGGITGFDSDDYIIYSEAINGTNGFTNDLGGGSFSLVVVDGNQLNLVYQQTSAVPEPSNYLALLVLLSNGLFLRRRVKRKA